MAISTQLNMNYLELIFECPLLLYGVTQKKLKANSKKKLLKNLKLDGPDNKSKTVFKFEDFSSYSQQYF